MRKLNVLSKYDCDISFILEPGPRPSWDSTTQRSESTVSSHPRPRPFSLLDTTLYSFPPTYSSSPTTPKEKGESYKEISRRLDCKFYSILFKIVSKSSWIGFLAE